MQNGTDTGVCTPVQRQRLIGCSYMCTIIMGEYTAMVSSVSSLLCHHFDIIMILCYML